jgi:SMODS-associated NUDIX domain
MTSDFIVNVLAGLFTSALIALLGLAFYQRGVLKIAVGYLTVHRHRTVRVSMSALIKITQDDRYLLVKSNLYPEFFGPFGGVYKYDKEALERLGQLRFVPQSAQTSSGDLVGDLRGFIEAPKFLTFVTWFKSGKDREDSDYCLRRELCEELKEIGLDDLISLVGKLRFKFVRNVMTNSLTVIGQTYSQVRWFDIYELVIDDAGQKFLTTLMQVVVENQGVISVTHREIENRRAAGKQQIAAQSMLLLEKYQESPEDPPLVL